MIWAQDRIAGSYGTRLWPMKSSRVATKRSQARRQQLQRQAQVRTRRRLSEDIVGPFDDSAIVQEEHSRCDLELGLLAIFVENSVFASR